MGANPKLIVLSEQLRGQTFELTGERYVIGRAEEATICIVDPTVSSNHCMLVRTDDGSYEAVDEGMSTNGTRINGMLVTRQKLINSDILQIGGVECMFDCEANTPSSVISTQTQIKLDDGVINANTKSNLAPVRLQGPEDSATVKLVFKLMVAGLLVVVLLLFAYLVYKLLTPGG